MSERDTVLKHKAYIKNRSHPSGRFWTNLEYDKNSGVDQAYIAMMGSLRNDFTAFLELEDWQRKIKFMKYTGYTDADGVPIFHGDIIEPADKHPNSDQWVVRYDKELKRFYLKNTNPAGPDGTMHFPDWKLNYKVVGSVIEGAQ